MQISGFWAGEYAYDSVKGLVVEFKANLEQLGAILSGDTTEENTFADQSYLFLSGRPILIGLGKTHILTAYLTE